MYLVAQISPFEWKKASVCNHYDDDEHVVEGNDCDDDDDEMNGNKFHHHSSNSLNCEEDAFMTNCETSITTMRMEENTTMELLEDKNERENSKEDNSNEGKEEVGERNEKEVVEEEEGDGNCCENYNTMSTLQQHQQYFKNMYLMNEQNDLESIWINMESRRNFLIERRKRQKQHHCQNGSPTHQNSSATAENLDIDDDGLIGFADMAALKQMHENDEEEYDEDPRDFTSSSFNEESSQNIELISYVNNFSLKNSFAWTLGTLLQSTSDLYPKV